MGSRDVSSSGASGGDTGRTAAAEADTIIERPQGEAEPAEDAETLSPGTRLGRYVVLEEIGSGGMGMVFSAYDPELNRKVALKLLRPRHRERKRNRNRLLQEAQALAKLAHPNVITVYDVGTLGERVFVAMELVEGDTLKGWLTQKKRKWDEVLEVYVPAGRGLAAAHAANLVHRDFKPENVLIGRDGRVRVMDFGLARPMRSDTESGLSQDASDSQEVPAEEEEDDDDDGREGDDVVEPMLTQTGSIMGTPAYMAPEQHLGKFTDSRSDQFSFSIALYQGLYGERPFDGTDAGQLMKQKIEGRIKDPPSGVSVPSWVRRVVLRGLATDAETRFASMDELLDELGKDPRVKRRKYMTAAGTVSLMVGAVLGIQYLRNQAPKECRDSEDRFAAVWNEERKTAAEAGVKATERDHVETSWAKTAEVIDAYGAAWIDMHKEACEATHLRGEQSARLLELRNNCLQERLDEIDALAGHLAEADAGIAARAPGASYALSRLSACADSEAMATAVDPPEGEQKKAEVAETRKQLAEIKVLGTLGKYDQALEQAKAAYATAGNLDYQPVLAEARYRLGQIQGLRGDGEQSQENLSEAAWLGASVKHDAIAASAAAEIVHLVGRRMGKHEDGLSWARHAEAAIKRIGIGGYQEARLKHDVGVIRGAVGDLEKSEEEIREAIKLYEAVPASAMATIDATRGLGDTRIGQGKLKESAELFQQAREQTEQLLGATHPDVALSIAGLGRTADAADEPKVARARFAEAIAMVEKALGTGDLALVPLLEQFADSYARKKEYGPAIDQKKRAYALLMDQLGKHPRVAATLHDIGNTLEAAARKDEARQHHARALAMWEETRGKDHPDVAYALTSLGLLDVEDGEPKRAVELLERALKLRGGRGLDPQLLATTQFALAQALHATGGDQPRARELATKARDTFARGKAPDSERAEQIERWLQQTQQPRDKTGRDRGKGAGAKPRKAPAQPPDSRAPDRLKPKGK